MTATTPAGLCANCRWVRLVRTTRGSSFLRCGLSDEDSRFPKYPPLPVRSCSGFAPSDDPSNDTDSGGANQPPVL